MCDVRTPDASGAFAGSDKQPGPSFGVMEDDAERVAAAGSDRADAVPQLDLVVAFAASHRPFIDSEYDGVALGEGHDMGTGLHARPLLDEDEFAAFEIPAGLRQQDRHLQREHGRTIEIRRVPQSPGP